MYRFINFHNGTINLTILFVILFFLSNRIEATFSIIEPECVFYEGADVRICNSTGPLECHKPLSGLMFNFNTTDNLFGDINECGTVLLNSERTSIMHYTVLDYNLTEKYIAKSCPGKHFYPANATTPSSSYLAATFQNDPNSWSSRLKYVGTMYTTSDRDCEMPVQHQSVCGLGNGVRCSMNAFSFHTPGFENHTVGWSGSSPLKISTDSAVCKCYVLVKTLNVTSVDEAGNKCYYTGIINETLPFYRIHYCPKFTENNSTDLHRASRDIVFNGQDVYSVDPQLLTCDLTEVNKDDYILIKRETSDNATLEFEWNGHRFDHIKTTESIITYKLPNDISNYGGLVTIFANYPDLSWGVCEVLIDAKDSCLREYGFWDTPWECMSTLTQSLWVFIYILVILTIILIFFVLVTFFLLLMTFCMSCFGSCRKIRLPWFKTALVTSSLADKTFALSTETYEAVMISLTSYLSLLSMLALLIAIIIMFIKCMGISRIREYMDKRKAMNKYNFESLGVQMSGKPKSKNSNNSFKKMVCWFMLLGVISCCNNNFLTDTHNNVCSVNQGVKTCYINTVIDVSMSSGGGCFQISSTSTKSPFSLKATLISSSSILNTELLYYTQLGQCSGQVEGSCATEDSQEVDDCNSFNEQYGPTCQLSPGRTSSFPESTGNKFTHCQCANFDNGFDCPASSASVTQTYAYSMLTPYNLPFPVYKSSIASPVFIINFELTSANQTSFNCYVTPFASYCPVPGLEIEYVSSSIVNSPVQTVYLFEYEGTHFHSDKAQPPGTVSNCMLGNVQLVQNQTLANSGSTDALAYKDFCSYNLEDPSDYGFASYESLTCSSNIADYGNPLPFFSPTLGTIKYVSNAQSGFEGYIIQDSPIMTSANFKFSFNKDLNFTIDDSTVCPKISDHKNPVGCYSCESMASFQLTAKSTCQPGTATLICNYPIANPVISLTLSDKQFTFYFQADKDYVKLNCELSGSTTDSISLSNSTPLSSGVVDLSQSQNSTITTVSPTDNEKEDLNWWQKLLCIVGAIILIFIIIIILLFFCGIIIKCI